MSYDLAVFDPRADLRDRSAFLAWFDGGTAWGGGLDYFDPSNATPALQAWYRDMVSYFPPLNGPDRPSDMALCRADYSIAADLIYVGFSNTSGMVAYETMFRLAAQHGVGFFDVSGNGSTWYPSTSGKLEMLHEHQESDPPGRLARMMAEATAKRDSVQVNNLEDAVAQMMRMMSDPKNMKPIEIRAKQQNVDDAME